MRAGLRRALTAFGCALVAGCVMGCDAIGRGCADPPAAGSSRLTSPGDTAFAQTAPDSFIVRFTTSRGDFFVQVSRRWAPRGADRFYNLVRNGYYDGNRFFRVVDGFVVQFGVSGAAEVNTAWARQCIADDPPVVSNTRRRLTFAFGLPNTRTTQLFVNLGQNESLDALGFAPLGEVIDGMAVVDSLFGGYGDTPPRGNGPDPTKLVKEGNGYLDREFPRLDSIVRARVVAER